MSGNKIIYQKGLFYLIIVYFNSISIFHSCLLQGCHYTQVLASKNVKLEKTCMLSISNLLIDILRLFRVFFKCRYILRS